MSGDPLADQPANPASPKSASKLGAKDKLLKNLTDKLEESKNIEEKSTRLSQQADEIADSDPEQAEKLRAEAWELEQKAKKLIRQAQRMQRGSFQGGAAGAGIGAGIAGGLGTLIGSLVGGVVAIPTTGLGMLVGAGTGAIHGPWVKLVQDTIKEEEEGEEDEEKEGQGGGMGERRYKKTDVGEVGSEDKGEDKNGSEDGENMRVTVVDKESG